MLDEKFSDMDAFYSNAEMVPDREKAKRVIEKDLDKSWFKSRKQGNTTLTYISGGRVKKLLNEAFDNKWSWTVLSMEVRESFIKTTYNKNTNKYESKDQPPYVLVHGRLTVPGFGSREAYGSKVIQFSEGADQQSQAFKAAETDALKVAASYFGIALELYIEDKEEEVDYDEEPTPKVEQPKKDIASSRGNVSTLPVNKETAKQDKKKTWADVKDQTERMGKLKEQAGFGKDNTKLNPLVEEWSKGVLKEFGAINPENIEDFCNFFEKKLNG